MVADDLQEVSICEPIIHIRERGEESVSLNCATVCSTIAFLLFFILLVVLLHHQTDL